AVEVEPVARERIAARAVDDRRDGGGPRVEALEDLDDLARGSAGRHDVLDDEDALGRPDAESAPELHAPVLALGELAARAESARDLVRPDDRAERRPDDEVPARLLLRPDLLRECLGQDLGARRVLEEERALEVALAV